MPDASEAARALARQRWGDTKLKRLAKELLEHREALDPRQRAVLESLAAKTTPKSAEGA